MKQKYNEPTSRIIPFQQHLCPILPQVFGNIDYQRLEERLEASDHIMRASGVDALFLNLSCEHFIKRYRTKGVEPSAKALARHQERSFHALHCTVLGNMTVRSLREQSMDIALSPLYRKFCGLECLGRVRVPGKSTLGEYRQWLSDKEMWKVNDRLVRVVSGQCGNIDVGLGEDLNVNVLWADSTCLDVNIHFPTDWVLLRDAVRTLTKSILTIRRHGLRHRIGNPQKFMTMMNQRTMEMSAQGRRRDSKRECKKVLRAMKKLTKLVGSHARRYRELLDTRWPESDLSRLQIERILARMDQVLR